MSRFYFKPTGQTDPKLITQYPTRQTEATREQMTKTIRQAAKDNDWSQALTDHALKELKYQ